MPAFAAVSPNRATLTSFESWWGRSGTDQDDEGAGWQIGGAGYELSLSESTREVLTDGALEKGRTEAGVESPEAVRLERAERRRERASETVLVAVRTSYKSAHFRQQEGLRSSLHHRPQRHER